MKRLITLIFLSIRTLIYLGSCTKAEEPERVSTSPGPGANGNPLDERLPLKERVLGIIFEGKGKACRFKNFASAPVVIAENKYKGQSFIVAGSKRDNFLVAFSNEIDGQKLSFSPIFNGTAIMEDQEGSQLNLFGKAISGPRTGQLLAPIQSFIGYWFAWGAFYSGADIQQ